MEPHALAADAPLHHPVAELPVAEVVVGEADQVLGPQEGGHGRRVGHRPVAGLHRPGAVGLALAGRPSVPPVGGAEVEERLAPFPLRDPQVDPGALADPHHGQPVVPAHPHAGEAEAAHPHPVLRGPIQEGLEELPGPGQELLTAPARRLQPVGADLLGDGPDDRRLPAVGPEEVLAQPLRRRDRVLVAGEEVVQGRGEAGHGALPAARVPQGAVPRDHLEDGLEGALERSAEGGGLPDPLSAAPLHVPGDEEAAHGVAHQVHLPRVGPVPGGVVVAQEGGARRDLVHEGLELPLHLVQRHPPVVGEGEDGDRPVPGRGQVVAQILDEVPVREAEDLVDGHPGRLLQLVVDVVRVEVDPVPRLGDEAPDLLGVHGILVPEVRRGDPRNDDDGRLDRRHGGGSPDWWSDRFPGILRAGDSDPRHLRHHQRGGRAGGTARSRPRLRPPAA